jgi:hypothetical protein
MKTDDQDRPPGNAKKPIEVPVTPKRPEVNPQEPPWKAPERNPEISPGEEPLTKPATPPHEIPSPPETEPSGVERDTLNL